MSDVDCPYCRHGQDVNHDDGYEEDVLHQQECSKCGKTFTYTTCISFYHDAYQADCLNGGEHRFAATHTYPVMCTKMECKTCGKKRDPTDAEWIEIEKARGPRHCERWMK